MIGGVFAAHLGQWRRSPLQLFTLIAGLALATALWSGVQAINAEARASYDAAAATLGEAQFDQLVPADGRPIAQDVYVRLRRAGWLVSPVVEGRADGVRIVGLEPLTAPGGLGPVQIGESGVAPFLGGDGQVFGPADALAGLPEGGPERVVAPDVAPGTVVTDIGVAQRLLGLEGRITRLILAPEQPIGRPDLSEIAPGLVPRAAGGQAEIGRLTDSFHLNLTAFGFLAFAVGIFIVHGAIGLAFEERRPLVRTLRALGVPLRTVIGATVAELVVLALAAGGIGLVLGWLIAAALLPDVAASLRGLYGADIGGQLGFRPGWWMSGLAMALVGTALAGGQALWRLARMPILAAARPRAWAMAAGRGDRVQAAAGAALLLVAGVLAVTAEGLGQGFALLACLLLGAALLLPMLLGGALRLAGSRAHAPLAQWFWADTRQQLPGLSLALMALLLAMAANVGVSTMVSSFRLTFTGFLDQRLAAELYFQVDDAEEAERGLAATRDLVREALPVMSVEARLAGRPGEILAIRDAETYRDNWRFLQAGPDPWDRLAAGEGVLVNEQLARRSDLGLGDRLDLPGAGALEILGVYGDYGNSVGQALLPEPEFRRLFPEVEALRYGLRIAPEDVPQAVERLVEAGIPEGAVVDQAGIKAFSLQVFERTFAVTGALNALTLAVAAFAMLMSLLTLAGLRLPQLAPVWALGITRATLGRREVLRSLMLAAATATLALPLGLALAWVLLAVVNVAAFGWQLPIHFFPLDWLRLWALAALAGGLAALWPARRLARTPPARLLKVFADER